MTESILQSGELCIRPLDVDTDYEAYLETKRLAGLPDVDNDDPVSLHRLLRVCPASVLVADTLEQQCIATGRASFTTPRIIGGVAVHPQWQRKKLGSVLMSDILNRMSLAGLKTSEILLDADVDIPELDLERFYGRFKFKRSFAALGMVRYEEANQELRWWKSKFNEHEPDIDQRRMDAFRFLYWAIKHDAGYERSDIHFSSVGHFNNGLRHHSDVRMQQSTICDTRFGYDLPDMAVQFVDSHTSALIHQPDQQLTCYEKRWALIHNFFNREAPLCFLSLITHPAGVSIGSYMPAMTGYFVAGDLSTDELLPLRLDRTPNGAFGGRQGAHMSSLEAHEAEHLLNELVAGASFLSRNFPAKISQPAYYNLQTGERIYR